jgi:hypothetical protein
MSAATVPEAGLAPEVQTFLKRHKAEEAFAKVCELVRDSFPSRLRTEYRLLDDPDTDDRQWLIIQIGLPDGLAASSELRDQEAEYHARLVHEVPLDMCPHFAVSYDFIGG